MKRQLHFKKLLSFCLAAAAILLANATQAQNWPSEVWHEGKVVLLEGDTLKGLVKYDLQQDLVQYSVRDKTADVFTARKLLFFEIFDESVHRYRQFFALPFTTAGGYKSPIFFELLEEGKMTLLAREFLEYKTISSPYYYGSYSRMVLSHKYFFLNEDGGIEQFEGNKNDLIDLMGKQGEEVEKYMRANRLRYEDKYDFAKIVAYYNSLSGT
jgi:hypothetical protein